MTFKEKIALDKERAAAVAQLREVAQVARTAIACMEQDASFFTIIAGAKWMQDIDPQSCGPHMICVSTAAHNIKLAADLKERMKGAPE